MLHASWKVEFQDRSVVRVWPDPRFVCLTSFVFWGRWGWKRALFLVDFLCIVHTVLLGVELGGLRVPRLPARPTAIARDKEFSKCNPKHLGSSVCCFFWRIIWSLCSGATIVQTCLWVRREGWITGWRNWRRWSEIPNLPSTWRVYWQVSPKCSHRCNTTVLESRGTHLFQWRLKLHFVVILKSVKSLVLWFVIW